MRYKEYVAKCLAPRACADRVAIKIYVEQLLTAEERFNEDGSVKEVTQERAQEVLNAFKARLQNIPKNEWQIIAILHDKDPASGGWSDATEKPHIHIIVRCVLKSKGETVRPRVNTYLHRLGIYYQIADDNPVDLDLWKNHGVEYCWHFGDYARYLLHKSDKAKAAGKEPYEIEEFIGNLTTEEIRQVMEDAVILDDSGEKVTPRKLAELDEVAYKLGYALADYDKWYGALPANIRASAKMRVVKESYDRGVDVRLKEVGRIPRLCVYIQSDKNMGKTEAAHYALTKLGVEYLDVCAGGTGKYDNLTPSTGAIVVDDAPMTHILAMADTRCCKVYRRGSGNRPWMGDYLIVTSNKPFDRWLADCGLDYDNWDAARSRFYICELTRPDKLDRDVLYCTSRAERGSDDFLRGMDAKYIAFRDFFNDSLASYSRARTARERIDINAVKVAPEETEAWEIAGEREREREQAEARFAEEMRAEFEDSIEPDEYLEAVMLALHMAEACA